MSRVKNFILSDIAKVVVICCTALLMLILAIASYTYQLQFGSQYDDAISLRNDYELQATLIFSFEIILIAAFCFSVIFYIQHCSIKNMQKITARYQVAISYSRHLLFEYDIAEDTLSFLSSHIPFNLPQTFTDPIKFISEYFCFDKQNKEKIQNVMVQINAKNPAFSEVIKYNYAGREFYFKHDFFLYFNKKQQPLYVFCISADITEEYIRELDLRDQVLRDALTSLFNRSALMTLIDEALQSANEIQAFLMIDIDDFKEINDSFGHQTGDCVIMRLAEKMQSIFRDCDIIGRLGGDEFVIFVRKLHSEKEVEKIVEKLQFALAHDIAVGGRGNINITVSVGVSFAPRQGQNFETLYEKADIALYKAKNQGKNHCAYYLEKI